ncbi:MAG: polyphosphate kinase 1 [Halovenus sp.]
MAGADKQYECLSCGASFDAQEKLQSHIDSEQTACVWKSSDDQDLSDPQLYLSRELSKLRFNERVLHEAADDRNPLLERVKFLSIFTRNMDEFFMKRVGGLKQQMASGLTEASPDGRRPAEHWREVLEVAGPLFERQSECYQQVLQPALASEGIGIVGYDALDPDEQSELDAYFERSILPTLTPLTIDSAKPFPHISNLSLSLGVLTREDGEDEPVFSRIKIPQNRPRLVQVDGGTRYVLLDDLVKANLDQLFPNVDVVETATFRVTRNAEVRRNEEVAEDLIQLAEDVIEERRFATVVRLEISQSMSREMLAPLQSNLDVDGEETYRLPPPLDLGAFMALTELDRPDLKEPTWTPQPHPRLGRPRSDDQQSVFSEIKRDDLLVHHPYHSFTGSVQRFLDEAANDPKVLAIKAAIYRTASDSKVIQSLIDAAENGKQVAVMVELKARFDEQNNLEWAKKLEEEGIHVAYGTIGYKTHTKTTLVVREEEDGVRLYSHIGTGNYHSETAKRYEDLGLFTASRDVGQDLVKLFNYFTGNARHDQYRKLLIAPGNMRRQFTEMIRRERDHARDGREAAITAKLNRLEDPEIIEELYRASQAGVDIDLVVRDICRLRPGLAGISDNVSVVSLVGRFLEHSRIFRFHDDGAEKYFIGSADWMERNLDNRVEAVTPIDDRRIQKRLDHILDLCLADTRKCWEMHPDGSYTQRRPEPDEETRNCQAILMDEAREEWADYEVSKTHRAERPPPE